MRIFIVAALLITTTIFAVYTYNNLREKEMRASLEAVLSGLISTGFEIDLSALPEGTQLQNIPLGADKIAEIGSIIIDTDRIVYIKNTFIDGSLGDGQFRFSGFDSKQDAYAINWSTLPYEIIIENMQVLVQTEHLASVSLLTNLKLRKLDNHYALQGEVETAQKSLRFNARINGRIDFANNITAEMTVQNLSYDDGFAAFARGNADIVLSGNLGDVDNIQIQSDFKLGRLSLMGAPFENISGQLQGNTSEGILTRMNAFALGGGDIRANFVMHSHGDDSSVFGGEISCPDNISLKAYIERHLAYEPDVFSKVDDANPVKLTFSAVKKTHEPATAHIQIKDEQATYNIEVRKSR